MPPFGIFMSEFLIITSTFARQPLPRLPQHADVRRVFFEQRVELSHEHRELVPIVDNDQDMTRLAQRVGATLDRHPAAHAFLLRRHGLYTWGASLADAERHVEILEFLFETIGRTQGGPSWR